MANPSPSVAFTRHVLSAWSRWSQRHARSGAQATLSPAELQAQYELLAAGVAATLSDDLVQLIWRDEQEADGETIWTLLLPLQERVEDDRERVHFLLVVVAELLSLGGDALTQGNGVRGTARAVWLVETLVMPLVKSLAFSRLHAIALVLVERLVRISSDRVATLLSQRVYDALLAEPDESERDDSAASKVSYVSLCRAFQTVLQSTEAFVRVAELNEQIKSVCVDAIEKFDRQPRYLRAVSVHLMPALVASAPTSVEELVQTAIATWKSSASVAAIASQGAKMRSSSRPSQGGYAGSQVSNLLYMLCLLLPKDPTLMREEGLQELIAFALTHDDPLLRKQALHLLKISFSHYAIETTATASGEPKSASGNKELETWQSFILASDVIQLHHELHLLEQVWPQVEHLLQSLLIVPASCDGPLNQIPQLRHSTSSSVSSSSSSSSIAPIWPVKFTFPWIQSLLMRVFRHENPIVRRMFLSNFMEACVNQLTNPAWALDQIQPKTVGISSFICDPQFEVFVFQHVLQACNDPLMYKSSRREPFQAITTQFLSLFLAFKVVVAPRKSSPASPGLFNTFVRSACDAVFGPGSGVHSPEAIVSSLQVFGDETLQLAVRANSDRVDMLDETSFERMRFILEVYVLRSFPLSMRTKLLQSLQQALTTGFSRCDEVSLDCLARTVAIFPTSHLLLSRGSALLELRQWLASTGSFRASMFDRVKEYLASSTVEVSPSVITAKQFARLLLLTADVDSSLTSTRLVLQRPVSDLVGDVSLFDPSRLDRLLMLLGSLEIELGELQADVFTGAGLSPRPEGVAPVVFHPTGFYGDHGLSCEDLYHAALLRAQKWLLGTDYKTRFEDLEDDEMLFEQDLLNCCGVLSVQLATFAMEETGDLALIHELGEFCELIKSFLTNATTKQCVVSGAKKQLHDQALALRFLSVVSSQPLAHDAIDAFECKSVLTILLGLEPNRQGTNSSRYMSDCMFLFASSKWRLIRNVIEASAYIPTTLLKEVFEKAVDSLFSAGADPQMLTDMVQVISMAMSRMGGLVVQGDASGGEDRLNEIFNEIWNAYGHAKPKSDSLTRAVIFCIFQPAFMRSRELVDGIETSLMKRWFRTIVEFGEVYRPNVLFHLACRVVQIWRVEPRAALPFADEIVELLLYREPIIADKQKSPAIPDMHSKDVTSDVLLAREGGFDGRGKKNALSAKDRFVRFIVLSFLDEMNLDDQGTKTSDEHRLLDIVLTKLLEMNFGDDAQKQQMLNSDGFGRRLRSWQAVTVLSKHITSSNVSTLSDSIWRAFSMTQLPMVRFYMEVLGMRLAMRFPEVTLDRHILPLLRNYNLTPQVGASVLLISGFFINHTMLGSNSEANRGDQNQIYANLLLEALLPWLNASHGHTRVMVQFLLGVLLPRHLHALESAGSRDSEIRFYQGIANFLSENKETKRMFRRQAKQFDTFQPDFQCTMFGMLTTAGLNEFNELFPDEDSASLSAQLKETMNILYEQFQREHFAVEQAVRQSKPIGSKDGDLTSSDARAVTSSINVQRKIDTSAILLDESVLPVAMRDRDELVEINIRQKRRQEVILCASLVDKVPNLAGLARTCEIFNAQKLVVPNIRVCDDEVFQTISVTANKWIPIEEVKEEGLVEALKRWKGDGYTIVAVEQTASSRCLSRFEFPEKIVIVLGKEKEGIPVDVLQMVDVCVEIPQFGLIRSLNVHVSGAILLWEYTQQRLTADN